MSRIWMGFRKCSPPRHDLPWEHDPCRPAVWGLSLLSPDCRSGEPYIRAAQRARVTTMSQRLGPITARPSVPVIGPANGRLARTTARPGRSSASGARPRQPSRDRESGFAGVTRPRAADKNKCSLAVAVVTQLHPIANYDFTPNLWRSPGMSTTMPPELHPLLSTPKVRAGLERYAVNKATYDRIGAALAEAEAELQAEVATGDTERIGHASLQVAAARVAWQAVAVPEIGAETMAEVRDAVATLMSRRRLIVTGQRGPAEEKAGLERLGTPAEWAELDRMYVPWSRRWAAWVTTAQPAERGLELLAEAKELLSAMDRLIARPLLEAP